MPYKIQRLEWSENSYSVGVKSFSFRYLGISPSTATATLSFSRTGVGTMTNANMTTYAVARANEVISAALTKLNDGKMNENIDWSESSTSVGANNSIIEAAVTINTDLYDGTVNIFDTFGSQGNMDAVIRSRTAATLNACLSATF